MIDLFLFMGQSNMAGRGETCDRFPEPAPALTPGAGYEYRAVTAPNCLFPICEPFGKQENRSTGIDDGDRKSGSMVTAFVNAYYERTAVPVVGISASKGGSSIRQWQPDTDFLLDTKARLRSAQQYLTAEHYHIRHTFLLWCQGETDGDHQMNAADYQRYFSAMWQELKSWGVEQCFLIVIGEYNGPNAINYHDIQQAQRTLAAQNSDITLVDDSFASMKERGLMKDSFHYYQTAYNEVGRNAGKNAAEYLKNI